MSVAIAYLIGCCTGLVVVAFLGGLLYLALTWEYHVFIHLTRKGCSWEEADKIIRQIKNRMRD